MAIAALSNAGFTQYVAASSNVSASQQALQTLQQSLAAGDLSAAQTAFATYQSLNQNLANAGGSGSASGSQLTTDLNTLGGALNGGDLTTAQQAFATVQSDLKNAPSPAVTSAENAAAQAVQWVDDLLTLSGSSGADTTLVDPTTAILSSAYGLSSSSNTAGDATDPITALLESAYGVSGSGSTVGSSGSSSGTTANADAPGNGVAVSG